MLDSIDTGLSQEELEKRLRSFARSEGYKIVQRTTDEEGAITLTVAPTLPRRFKNWIRSLFGLRR